MVWSIRARRSTPAQARNICTRQFMLLGSNSTQVSYRDDSPLGHIVCLFVELVDFALGGRLVCRDTIWRTRLLRRSQDSGRGRRLAGIRVFVHFFSVHDGTWDKARRLRPLTSGTGYTFWATPHPDAERTVLPWGFKYNPTSEGSSLPRKKKLCRALITPYFGLHTLKDTGPLPVTR